MIPYFQYNSIILGPITIQVWGLMVALGIVAATLLMNYLAKKLVLSKNAMLDLAIWVIVGGFLFARVFHVVFYELDFYLINPDEILAFWHGGLSSLGGLFGAALAVYLFSKKRKFGFKELLPYFDVMALSLWVGWAIGRLGCFLIHDHPGTLSNFALSVNFPEGARHDLGLYDSILAFTLFILFALLFKPLTKKGWGLVSGLSFLLYAATRFLLDFLRATDLPISDARYGSLTPAQWGMLVVALGLTFVLIRGRMPKIEK